MKRREFCKLMSVPVLAQAAAAERPNIVYILADDLGWGDLRCYNPKSAVPTPNADRLARRGMRFTDMHSPSAVCTPTRYGILTGRYCWRTRLKKGVLNGYSPNLIEHGRMTLASMLKANGYTTAGVGKWHLGLREDEKTNFTRPLHPGPGRPRVRLVFRNSRVARHGALSALRERSCGGAAFGQHGWKD